MTGELKEPEASQYLPYVGVLRADSVRDVNMNAVLDVVNSIQTAVNQGLSGVELSNAIIDQFDTVAPRPQK